MSKLKGKRPKAYKASKPLTENPRLGGWPEQQHPPTAEENNRHARDPEGNKVGAILFKKQDVDDLVKKLGHTSKEAKHAAKLIQLEMQECINDFFYFCENYYYIKDRHNRTSLLKPTPEQEQVVIDIEVSGRVLIVKARKLGMSTVLSAYGLWLAMFHSRFCGTIAHQPDSVQNIFEKVRFAYSKLPEWMKRGDFEADRNSKVELRFPHGGAYRVGTDKDEKFRGGDLYFAHFSELAAYRDPKKVFNATLDSLVPDAVACIETTARGMGFLHGMWVNRGNAWTKLFFDWKDEPSYVRDELPSGIHADDLKKLEELADNHGLTTRQANFAAHKLAEKASGRWDWRNFHQEWPLTADLAFAVAEGRVFEASFDVGPFQSGVMEFQPVATNGRYFLGFDASSGSDTGDYQAVYVLSDDYNKPEVCCSAVVQLPQDQFGELVYSIATKWNNALIVGENNTYGLSVLMALREAGYPNIWRKLTFDKVGNPLTDKMGFSTNVATRSILTKKMQQYLGGPNCRIDPACPRLKKAINDFVYNPDTGKQEAAPGCYDDPLFAFALATIGLEPNNAVQHKGPVSKRPRSEMEILRYEVVNQTVYDPTQHFDDDTEEERQELQAYMQHLKSEDPVLYVEDVFFS